MPRRISAARSPSRRVTIIRIAVGAKTSSGADSMPLKDSCPVTTASSPSNAVPTTAAASEPTALPTRSASRTSNSHSRPWSTTTAATSAWGSRKTNATAESISSHRG